MLKRLPNRFKVTVPEVFHMLAVRVKGAGEDAAHGPVDFVPVRLQAGLCHLSMLRRDRNTYRVTKGYRATLTLWR
jgi:hypothetical protein